MKNDSVRLIGGTMNNMVLTPAPPIPLQPGQIALRGDCREIAFGKEGANGLQWSVAVKISNSLFGFDGFEFHTADTVGRTGPTLAKLRTAYASESWAQDDRFFNVNGGKQLFTVPEDGLYRIEAIGGHPNMSESTYTKIRVAGNFQLRAGDTLTIICGQPGDCSTNQSRYARNNGAGASLVQSRDLGLLLIAGGIGGADYNGNLSKSNSLERAQHPTKLTYGDIGAAGNSVFDYNNVRYAQGGASLTNSPSSTVSHSSYVSIVVPMPINGAATGGAINYKWSSSGTMYGGFGGGGAGQSDNAAGGGGGYSGGYANIGLGGNGASYISSLAVNSLHNTVSQNNMYGRVSIQRIG